MKLQFSLISLLVGQFLFAQSSSLGTFEKSIDIGKPKLSGSARYDETNQTYDIKGAGYNIWFNRDEFQFVYRQISGDFILTANFEFVGEAGTEGHRKMGWMIRESTDPEAAAINACAHLEGLTVLQWRPLRGAYMRDPEDEIFFPKKSFQIIQLERIGKKITMRVAHPGEPLQTVGSHEMMDLKDTVLAGIYICSHDSNALASARVWNVRIDRPVSNNYNPDKQGWLGSRLEIMNVSDGSRKVIHESKGRFEAPNWMPDGRNLLFNEGGSIYKIPVTGGNPEKLNTGAADKNNNDHGIFRREDACHQ
jgi:hypothetical protein